MLQWHQFAWQPWCLTIVSKESHCSFSPDIDLTSYCGSISMIESLDLYQGYHGNHHSTQGSIL